VQPLMNVSSRLWGYWQSRHVGLEAKREVYSTSKMDSPKRSELSTVALYDLSSSRRHAEVQWLGSGRIETVSVDRIYVSNREWDRLKGLIRKVPGFWNTPPLTKEESLLETPPALRMLLPGSKRLLDVDIVPTSEPQWPRVSVRWVDEDRRLQTCVVPSSWLFRKRV